LLKLSSTPPAVTVDPSTIEIMTTAATGAITRQIGAACDQCTVESVALDGGTWLTGDSASGQLSIGVDATQLSPGTYRGVVRLIPAGGRCFRRCARQDEGSSGSIWSGKCGRSLWSGLSRTMSGHYSSAARRRQ
jgi:hypothetical protein